MRCFYCKEDSGSAYVCDACRAKSAVAAAESEAAALKFTCPDCGVPSGRPCLTGSRGPRQAHARRNKLAAKAAKKKVA
jgi:predicted RNA-binding Zn-ribbon protein involved in translation (DUF1610 family)